MIGLRHGEKLDMRLYRFASCPQWDIESVFFGFTEISSRGRMGQLQPGNSLALFGGFRQAPRKAA